MFSREIEKPESFELVREWARFLNERRTEVKSLLLAEGMSLESVFLDSDSLVYYLRAEDLALTRKRSRESQHYIDIFHREMLTKFADGSVNLECLFDCASDE